MATNPRTHDAYTVGWVCALSKEQTAAIAMLEEEHPNLPKPPNDPNSYTLGSICGHNIVIACLPKGKIGIGPAATVATHMVGAFPAVRFGLMVGIGGGVSPQVRLGDVVVSVPVDQFPGVVQWDMGKAEQGGTFRRTGALNNPPSLLLTALTTLETKTEMKGTKIPEYLDSIKHNWPLLVPKYLRSDSLQDVLFKANYSHVEKQYSDASEEEEDASEDDAEEDCRHCDKTQIVERKPRDMRVHYGLIASGNQVVKDASVRNQLRKDIGKNVLCVEMEAAGLMDNFPCIVIRGICDYADSHKNKAWQEHAAAVAAAFAKELLGYVQPQEVDQEKTAKDALAQVNENLVMLSSGVKNVQSRIEFMRKSKHGDDVMRWLGAPDVSSNFNKADQISHPGSGQRLIQGELYQSWKTQEKSFLWLHGIPGCGKTILTSTVIKDLITTPERGKKILYFYFDFTDVQKQTFEKCVRSLLDQFYHADGSDRREVDSLYSSCKNGKEQPSMSSLQATFVNMVQQAGGAWIILDALDECPSRAGLLSWLRQLVSSELHVHLLVTSRPEQDIQSAVKPLLADGYKINVQDDVIAGDIYNYVQARISEHESLSRWKSRPDLQAKIKSTMLSKANGMFRWVACQFDALEDCYSPDDLLGALESLPETLGGTYERILANIPRKHMHYTRRLLQFLTYSERPLRLDEAVDAIAVAVTDDEIRGSHFHPGKRMPIPSEITRYCSSLVVLVEKTSQETHRYAGNGYDGKLIVQEIQLAHFSVKDYLVSDLLEKETAAYLQVIPARSAIAEVCLTYLSDIEPYDATSTRERFPFAQYSAQFWARHAVVADRERHRVFKLAEELLSNHDRLQSWYRLYNPDRPWESQPKVENMAPALYYASLEGLSQCVHALLGKGFDVNAQGGEYGNALYAALSRGHWGIVQLLIENGADIKAQGGPYGSALHAAIFRGHLGITQLLLDKGADINVKGRRYDNALHAAISRGHREIVQLLIENGADINSQVEDGSALQAAILVGHQEIVQTLLDNGADVNAQGGKYGNALYAASSKGYQKIVQLLFKHGANVNAQGGRFGNSLQVAIIKGHQEILQLLVKYGANVNAQGGEFGNALQAAIIEGYQEIVQVLVKNGANVNAQGGRYGNALQAAVIGGHQEIVQCLVTHGADVNAQGGEFGNALYAASSKRYQDIVQILVDNGANVNAQGGRYGNALYAAVIEGHQEIVQILVNNGANVNAQGGRYGNALQTAAIEGHQEIVQILVKHGANVNAHGGRYGNALQAAAIEGHQEIVQILVKHGANVNAHGGRYGNALQAAAIEGHQEIVQILVKYGANVNAQGGEVGNALQAAAIEGHQEIVQILIKQGADINAQGGRYGNALQTASSKGHREIVQFLVKNGANVNVEGGELGNALQAASFKGYQEIVQILVKHGADINAQGGRYGNALQAASSKGHREIVQFLVKNGANVNVEGRRYGHRH